MLSFLASALGRRYRRLCDGYVLRGNVNEKAAILVGLSLIREIERQRRHTLGVQAQQAIADVKSAAFAETEQLVVTFQALIHLPLADWDTRSRRTSIAISAYQSWRAEMDSHLKQAQLIRAVDDVKHPLWRRKSYMQAAALMYFMAGTLRLLLGADNEGLAFSTAMIVFSLILLMELAIGRGCLLEVVAVVLLGVTAWQHQTIDSWVGDARPWSVVVVLLLFGVLSVLAERSLPRAPRWSKVHRRNPHEW